MGGLVLLRGRGRAQAPQDGPPPPGTKFCSSWTEPVPARGRSARSGGWAGAEGPGKTQSFSVAAQRPGAPAPPAPPGLRKGGDSSHSA